MVAAPAPTRQVGFTLVELLVASAVFLLVALAAYNGLDRVLGTRDVIILRAEQLHELQASFDRLSEDLLQVVARPVRDELGDDQPALSVDGGTDPLIQFTRGGWVNPAELPRAELQRVAYRLDDGRLYRLYWPHLDRLQGAQPVERLLAVGVEGVQVRCMNAAREWGEQWPPAGAPVSALPLAVELRLVLGQGGEIRRVFALPG